MLAALILALPVAAPAESLKLGYVDYQRALLEVNDGKAARARLQAWLDDRQKEIDREQDALRKEKKLLDGQAGAMSEGVRAQKAAELQRKVNDLSQTWERYRSESADRERREMEPIVAKIDKVIATIASRDGYALVFEKRDSGLVYAQPQYDLTDEVIRSYNQ